MNSDNLILASGQMEGSPQEVKSRAGDRVQHILPTIAEHSWYALVLVPSLRELLPRSGIPATKGNVGLFGLS
jgi:hypothetical protein